MAALLYGAGLRLMECCDCASRTSISTRARSRARRQGRQGSRHVLPQTLVEPLRSPPGARARSCTQRICAAGYGAVHLPYALARKYPNAAREWGWQYVFPAAHACA